jgi:cytochrome P450
VIRFLSDDMRRDPFPVYDQLRRISPVLHDAQSNAWMIFDYDGVKLAVNDHDAFSSFVSPSGLISKWLVFLDPPRHSKLRALIMRAFTPRVVASLEPRIRKLTGELLDAAIERGEMDVAADFSTPLPMMVIAQMLGIPDADWPDFKRWSDIILDLSYTLPGGDEAVRATEAFRAVSAEMRGYLAVLLGERSAAPRDDLLTKLVEAEVDGERLTEEEILAFFQLLLVAGQETTTNLINNAILCFVKNPVELARLEAAPELLPSAIEEVLRYRSPVQWVLRSTRCEVTLHGQTVPAGALVLPVLGSANRDERYFDNAERFDIARDPNPHIAFGHGIHFCLGAALSRLEAKVALPVFLNRVRNFELMTEAWEPRKALHVHGPARLPIRFEPGQRGAAEAQIAV